MRFARLLHHHGPRYRHSIVALDNVIEMESRLATDAQIQFRTVNYRKGAFWTSLRIFGRTIGEIDPDVLVTYNWGAIEWALANRLGPRRKHVHIEDGFGPEEARRQLRRRVWLRRLALSGKQTTVVLPSRNLEQIALRRWKLQASRVLYIPNGIDCERFGVDIDERRGRRPPVTIGTVATLRREKNIPRLIEAFCSVAKDFPNNELSLLIVGDGPERRVIEGLIEGLIANSPSANQIELTGATAEPELSYRRMDVFALSSDTEQMPLSVLEAMAAGLPVVSPSVGDVPHIVSPENAPQIVAGDDENAYRAAIAALLRSAELRLAIGLANQRKAREQFDERLMATRYARVFG
jgi:glycosyltransferase involved in cell wall biosynthesis